jgi:hypothetical protein
MSVKNRMQGRGTVIAHDSTALLMHRLVKLTVSCGVARFLGTAYKLFTRIATKPRVDSTLINFWIKLT